MVDKTFRFGFAELGLTVSSVEEVIGYNEGEDREYVRTIIGEILSEAAMIADVRAEYSIFKDVSFTKEDRSVNINGTSLNIEKIVWSQISKAESAVLFLCTAGEEIGKRSRHSMQERDFLTGFIYDVVGSEAVEAAADLMQADLEISAASEGLKITNRYSPGYCGWNVAEQHKLFSLVPANFCNIRLTPSALMDPEKSVSGIIGIGQNVKMNPYICRMCDMEDCIYRKIKEKGRGGEGERG
jgi:hypothetical protein